MMGFGFTGFDVDGMSHASSSSSEISIASKSFPKLVLSFLFSEVEAFEAGPLDRKSRMNCFEELRSSSFMLFCILSRRFLSVSCSTSDSLSVSLSVSLGSRSSLLGPARASQQSFIRRQRKYVPCRALNLRSAAKALSSLARLLRYT